jgi:hypothetical protein
VFYKKAGSFFDFFDHNVTLSAAKKCRRSYSILCLVAKQALLIHVAKGKKRKYVQTKQSRAEGKEIRKWMATSLPQILNP